jgi:hypothetical protein
MERRVRILLHSVAVSRRKGRQGAEGALGLTGRRVPIQTVLFPGITDKLRCELSWSAIVRLGEILKLRIDER